ncbi:MAG: hypothetical protein EBS90_05555 [Betaproteobacteria bacterium]|nr:hypothetical protein [Betaproteobacteria bacterium]
MTRLLSAVMGLAFLLAVLLGLQSQGAAVSIWVGGWRLDMALSTAIVSLIVIVGLLLGALRLLRFVGDLPGFFRRQRAHHKEVRRLKALAELVLDFSEGRYARVTKEAEDYDHDFGLMTDVRLPVSRLVASLAARAAHTLGDFRLREQWLSRLQGVEVGRDHHPQLKSLLIAEFALDQRNGQTALHALEPILKGDRKHVYAMRLSLKAHQLAGEWAEVLRILRLLENRKAIAPLLASKSRERAVEALIQEASGHIDRVRDTIGLLKGDELHETGVAKLIAHALLACGQQREARRIVEASLKMTWDDSLLVAYADCEDDPREQEGKLEEWGRTRVMTYEMAWARGRMSLVQGRTEQAESFFERARSLRPTVRVCLALADLAERRGDAERARALWHQAAALA